MGAAAWNRGSRKIAREADIAIAAVNHRQDLASRHYFHTRQRRPERETREALRVAQQKVEAQRREAERRAHLPEGTLRSTFLDDSVLGGTQLFLSYEGGWYIVHTRFQSLARRRNLDDAAAVYERIDMDGVLP